MEFCMRVHRLFVCIVFLAVASSAQDWQDCKPKGDYSFNDVKAAVHRVTSSGMYSGWDEKTFNRSGDLVAVAVLKSIDDSEMASPENAKWVLLVIREAFACPQRCVQVTDDRRPRITLLLLEHLNEITRGKMQADIKEVKQFVLEQARKAN
jgi:hypothetical protein